MRAGLGAAKSNLTAEERSCFYESIDIEKPRNFNEIFDIEILKYWLLGCDEAGPLLSRAYSIRFTLRTFMTGTELRWMDCLFISFKYLCVGTRGR